MVVVRLSGRYARAEHMIVGIGWVNVEMVWTSSSLFSLFLLGKLLFVELPASLGDWSSMSNNPLFFQS